MMLCSWCLGVRAREHWACRLNNEQDRGALTRTLFAQRQKNITRSSSSLIKSECYSSQEVHQSLKIYSFALLVLWCVYTASPLSVIQPAQLFNTESTCAAN